MPSDPRCHSKGRHQRSDLCETNKYVDTSPPLQPLQLLKRVLMSALGILYVNQPPNNLHIGGSPTTYNWKKQGNLHPYTSASQSLTGETLYSYSTTPAAAWENKDTLHVPALDTNHFFPRTLAHDNLHSAYMRLSALTTMHTFCDLSEDPQLLPPA